MRLMVDPVFREKESAERKQFEAFSKHYKEVLSYRPGGKRRGNSLVVGLGGRWLETELFLTKALEVAGYEPIVLAMYTPPYLKECYSLTGARVCSWEEFDAKADEPLEEKGLLSGIDSVEQLMSYEFLDTRVGQTAVASAFRKLRVGSLDFENAEHRKTISHCLALGLRAAETAHNIISQLKPRIAMFAETEYTRKGELFDVCLKNDVEVIRWHPSHKSNSLMIKRYSSENRGHHLHSLSGKTWGSLSRMKWTSTQSAQVQKELENTYAQQDWYGEIGTQFGKQMTGPQEIRDRLALESTRKTAFIFPHILWDASLMWGRDLFDNYEDWLVKTIQAAIANDKVNWVIKLHPVHRIRSQVEKYQDAPAELISLRSKIGRLPAHIRMLMPEDEIATNSLFAVMDYCLTVRGTVGIEAACRGIPVITGGTGRYDRKGFTIDSESQEEYLDRFINIQNIPPLTPQQRELAERFAYGMFLLRPMPLRSAKLEFSQNFGTQNYFTRGKIDLLVGKEWDHASDVAAFAEWVNDPDSEDFLVSVPGEAPPIYT